MIKHLVSVERLSIWLLKLSKMLDITEVRIGGVWEHYCMKCSVHDPHIIVKTDNKCCMI